MKIFLAAPFTKKIDSNTKLVKPKFRKRLEGLISHLEGKKHHVINSHVREEWGKKLEPPEISIINDFTSIRDSDLLLACLGNPYSPGVLMELGFASSIGKKIIILKKNNSDVPYLVKGIHKITETIFIKFDNQEDLISKIDKYI